MKKGFSMIEMVVVMAVMIILSIAGILNLVGNRNVTNLNDATVQAVGLLRSAQSNAMSQNQGTSWGVRFGNISTVSTTPFYSLFKTSYSVANRTEYLRLPPGVAYTSTPASGTSVDITFSQISGAASASTTIKLYLLNQPQNSSTISVASSGAITY